MVSSRAMEGFHPKGFWAKIVKGKAASRVARELAGPEARTDLLGCAGYGRRPDGLAARLVMELDKALPLHTNPAGLRGFGPLFKGKAVMARARSLATDLPVGGVERVPASQVDLPYSLVRERWPWLSGQGSLALARAWALSKDQDLLVALEDGLRNYCRQNPPLMGMAWARPHWLAIRALNWLVALRFAGGQSGLNPEVILDVLVHLRVTGQVLAQEMQSRPNPAPGLVEAAGALLFMGCCLPFLPEAPDWLALAESSLGSCLAAWQKAGGDETLPADRAAQACECGGLALWLASRQGLELPGLEQGLRGLAWFCRVAAPPWGDGGSVWQGWDPEPGRGVLGWGHEQADAFTRAANLAALLLNDEDLRGGRVFDEGLYWLLGPEAKEGLRRLAGGTAPGAGELPGAGLSLACARAAGRKVGLWFRNTSSKPAQALALGLCLEGKLVLAAPGPSAGGPLAGHLEARQAQNLVLIDQAQAKAGRLVQEALEHDSRKSFWAGRFEGYGHLPDPVSLRRRVYLDHGSGILQVVDQVLAAGEHLCEIMFHLPPGAKAAKQGGGLVLRGEFGQVTMRPQEGVAVRVAQGRSDPPLGWLASEAGELAPAVVVVLGARVEGNASLTTVLELAK